VQVFILPVSLVFESGSTRTISSVNSEAANSRQTWPYVAFKDFIVRLEDQGADKEGLKFLNLEFESKNPLNDDMEPCNPLLLIKAQRWKLRIEHRPGKMERAHEGDEAEPLLRAHAKEQISELQKKV
jgi:hypothetical protein